MRILAFMRFKGFGSVSIALIAATGAFLSQRAHHNQQSQHTDRANYIRQERSSSAILEAQKRLPALGFENLIAGWTYLQFIQYFGDGEARAVTGYSLNRDYFEIIVDLDPRFWRASLSLSSATSLFGGRPDITVELLGKALQSLPNDTLGTYFVNTYRGVDQMLFLGDVPGARRSYERAAEVARRLPDDPEVSRILSERASNTARFLKNNPDSRKARVGAWTQIFSLAADDETRERAIQEIRLLGGTVRRNPDGTISIITPED